ncbi:MAG: SGNH/GDSL hydrolase family protein [Ginsengibacter sp.]
MIKKNILLIATVFVLTSFNHKNISWIAIGDSITYLNEHTEETGNRVVKGYMTRVVEKYPYIHYINQGHNGWTSGDIAKQVETIGLTKADLYSVFLGTNDWWQGRPVGTFEDYQHNTGINTAYGSFRIIIDKLRDLNDKAKIILITPMQRADFVYIANLKNNAYGSYKDKNGQSLALFAEAIKKIAVYEHFDVIDLYNKKSLGVKNLVNYKRLKEPQTGVYKNYSYPAFIGVPFNAETDDYPYPINAMNITYDGLHPSDKGYSIIAKAIIRILRLM